MRPHPLCLSMIVLALVLSGTGAADEAPTFTKSGHTTDGLPQVKKAVTAGQAILLDVREQEEWDAGHLKRAHLLPLSIIRIGDFTAEQKKLLPKDRPVYCHCRSGGRVLAVSRLLRAKGYDIRPLKAGYADLVKSGLKKAESTE